MLDLRADGLKVIPEFHPNILQEVAGDLDVADVCRMPLRADVVVLQDASHVEEVHERFFLVVQVVAIHGFDLGNPCWRGEVRVSALIEAEGEGLR